MATILEPAIRFANDGFPASPLMIGALHQADEESRVYLQHLEERVDRDEERLPSGDDVAGELEAFLRELGSSEDES